jgi:angio-associated migratory cell protein
MREDTPPSSPYRPENLNPNGDDDLVEGEDDLVYYGTLDEFLENEGGEGDDEQEYDEDQEMDEELNEEPVRDDAVVTFSAHTSAIFCGSFHPTENWAVTGGEDDRAFVWNCETGEVLYEVQGEYHFSCRWHLADFLGFQVTQTR